MDGLGSEGRRIEDDHQSQVVDAQSGSTISNVAQLQVAGDMINSIVVASGGSVIIQYRDGKEEAFHASKLRKQYLEAIISEDRFNRWAADRFIDEEVRLLPMNIGLYDLRNTESISSAHYDLVDTIMAQLDSRFRILLLGEPGAGKTTALERLTFSLAHHGLVDSDAPIPMLIPLNAFNGDLLHSVQASLSTFSREHLREVEMRVLLANVNMVIFFDGLNELGIQKERGVRAIRTFMDMYPQHRYVITCRTHEYHNDIGSSEAWEILPLRNEDIERFLKTCFAAKGVGIYYQLRQSENLLNLARNPLLLGMIVEAEVGGRLPENRGELFQRFVNRLLWREGDKGDQSSRVPSETKKGVLAQLGYEMQLENVVIFGENRVRDCFYSYLQEWKESWNWRELLSELRQNGLLVPATHGWSFVHQLFQEFFAACALENAGLEAVTSQGLLRKREWNEVMLLLAGFTSESSSLIAYLVDEHPYLAAEAILQGAKPDTKVLQRVVERLGDMAAIENWTTRRRCVDLLGGLRTPLSLPYIRALMTDSNQDVRWGAINSAGKVGVEEETIAILLLLLNDPYDFVRGKAIMTLGELGIEETYQHIGPLLDSENPYLRVCSTYALVKLQRSAVPQAFDELLESKSTRISALSKFAATVAAEADQVAFLRTYLRHENPIVIEAAIFLLVKAEIFDAAGDIVQILTHESPALRATAAGALGRLEAREFSSEVTRLIAEDPDPIVREYAVTAIDWMGERGAFRSIIKATGDSNERVRFAAARSLGSLRIPEAKPTLRELAATDPVEWVRLHAIRSLGMVGNQDDMAFLLTQLEQEPETTVREAIVETIRSITEGERSPNIN